MSYRIFHICNRSRKLYEQAFSRQRSKLKPDFFHSCNCVLLSGFYRHYGGYTKRWKGNLLWAVEDSTLPLPQTEALRQVFGGATNQSVSEPVSVTARVCVFYDVLNRLVIKQRLSGFLVAVFVGAKGCKICHAGKA